MTNLETLSWADAKQRCDRNGMSLTSLMLSSDKLQFLHWMQDSFRYDAKTYQPFIVYIGLTWYQVRLKLCCYN
jgi:hypothetical protein